MKIRNFRDLEVWKIGKEIVMDVYRATALFPRNEVYGLAAQMRRASVSIPSNVAEGFNRFHNKEYRQLLFVALGSCAELETQVEISSDLGYVERHIRDLMIEKLDHETRMLRNLIKKL
jgi:four helix bundle protein